MKQSQLVQPAVFAYYEHISYALNLSNMIIVLDKMHDTLQVKLKRHDQSTYEFAQNNFVQGNSRQNCISKMLLPLAICSSLPTGKYNLNLLFLAIELLTLIFSVAICMFFNLYMFQKCFLTC